MAASINQGKKTSRRSLAKALRRKETRKEDILANLSVANCSSKTIDFSFLFFAKLSAFAPLRETNPHRTQSKSAPVKR
ncbi:MAG: hypothetical protein H0T51_11450 [Pirellulales bacterium]|nr:hypothetical protein [Pirellulales bacterium]